MKTTKSHKQTTLEKGDYMSAEEVADDVALVWRNCRTFNPPEHPIVKMAEKLEHYWTRRYQRSFNRPPPTLAFDSKPTMTPSSSSHQIASPPSQYTAPVHQPLPITPAPRKGFPFFLIFFLICFHICYFMLF